MLRDSALTDPVMPQPFDEAGAVTETSLRHPRSAQRRTRRAALNEGCISSQQWLLGCNSTGQVS
jgi:hypothetical protein